MYPRTKVGVLSKQYADAEYDDNADTFYRPDAHVVTDDHGFAGDFFRDTELLALVDVDRDALTDSADADDPALADGYPDAHTASFFGAAVVANQLTLRRLGDE